MQIDCHATNICCDLRLCSKGAKDMRKARMRKELRAIPLLATLMLTLAPPAKAEPGVLAALPTSTPGSALAGGASVNMRVARSGIARSSFLIRAFLMSFAPFEHKRRSQQMFVAWQSICILSHVSSSKCHHRECRHSGAPRRGEPGISRFRVRSLRTEPGMTRERHHPLPQSWARPALRSAGKSKRSVQQMLLD